MANKVIYRRRRRQAPAAHDSKFFKKDASQEQSFFGDPQKQAFFQNQHVQRKCDHCEQEDKKEVHRAADKKEEEKPVHRMEDKKEDKEVHRATDKKEEDKTVHRMEDKKEDKGVHRKEDKKEDEKMAHRMEDKKEEKDVHRKADAASSPATASASSYISNLGGKGNELPASSKHFFQTTMGADFSDVKIHTGTEAEQSAAAINAKAYTVDNHIVFAANQFNTETHEGKKLLAHELTHVMQQSDGINRKATIPSTTLPEAELEGGIGNVTGKGTSTSNQIAHGGDVKVEGLTTANYDHGTFATTDITAERTKGCKPCGKAPCVSLKGTLVSEFHADPKVKLPTVPPGHTPCETEKIQTFIDTKLTNHEQEHVNAFNTYNGTVNTPFTFTGCYTEAELKKFVQPIHDKIEKDRETAANLLSKKLDPFLEKIGTEECTDRPATTTTKHAAPPPHH
jgi:hypothetical protein